MFIRLLVGTVVVYLLTGCVSQPKPATQAVPMCEFVINAEVDGVTVATAAGQRDVSTAGGALQFSLPCGQQVFLLTKSCYEAQQVTLAPAPASVHVLTREDWEHQGYLRVENDSASEPLVIGRLPESVLEVPAFSHASRKVPLGDYKVEVRAPFKVPVEHEFRLCSKDEIYSLRVGTKGPKGELQAQGVQDITLEHGMGSLRVVTETPNLTFRIEPDRSEDLRRFLAKVGVDVGEIDLEQAPVALRKGLELLQRFSGKTFKAPILVTLPAGEYTLAHNVKDRNESQKVEVLPGRETKSKL